MNSNSIMNYQEKSEKGGKKGKRGKRGLVKESTLEENRDGEARSGGRGRGRVGKEKRKGEGGKERRCTCAGDSELCSDVNNGSDFVFSLVEFNHGRIGSDNGRGPAIRTKDFIGETDCGGIGEVVEIHIGRTLS